MRARYSWRRRRWAVDCAMLCDEDIKRKRYGKMLQFVCRGLDFAYVYGEGLKVLCRVSTFRTKWREAGR